MAEGEGDVRFLAHPLCFVPVAMYMALNIIGQVAYVMIGGYVDFD